MTLTAIRGIVQCKIPAKIKEGKMIEKKERKYM